MREAAGHSGTDAASRPMGDERRPGPGRFATMPCPSGRAQKAGSGPVITSARAIPARRSILRFMMRGLTHVHAHA